MLALRVRRVCVYCPCGAPWFDVSSKIDQEVEMLRVQGVGFAKGYLGRAAFGSLGRNLFREPALAILSCSMTLPR